MTKSIFLSFCLLTAICSANSQTVTENCGCEDKPLPEIIAIINDVKITGAELEAPIQARLKELRQQVIDARKEEVSLQINTILLETEALRRGISPTQLIQTEVVQKVQTPTEAEAQAFYDQNKSRIGDDFSRVKNNIIDYLREQRQMGIAQAMASRLRAAAQLKIDVPIATPPLTTADRARVFAVVNGKQITSADIENSLRPLIFRVQGQVYAARKRELDVRINDLLLEREAKKRGGTTKDLLATEIDAKTTVVTEQEALKFFNENKDRIKTEFQEVKLQIIQYLTEQDKEKRALDFAEQLRRQASLQVFLTPPEPPVYKIATDDQPAKGDPKALVTIVEFTDYQCPSCAQHHSVFQKLISEYGDRIHFVVRDFPLSQHKQAWKAAEAAEAAREQGKYWEFVALLYTRQSALQPDKLKQYATELGLDRARFDAALDSGKFSEKVQRDFDDGQKVGVSGTPSIFINGRNIPDLSYEALKAAIDASLKKAG